MQGKSKVISEVENRERVFNGGAYMSHYAHVKVGVRKDKKCRFCEKGMDSLVATHEKAVRADPVDEDSGDDEERAASYPSGDGDRSDEDFQLRW